MRKETVGALAAHALLGTYYRYRPLPDGINGGTLRTYRVPAEDIAFFHDTTWYEDGERRCVKQLPQEIENTIGGASSLVLVDVFLFNLHHTSEGSYEPTTRRVADAFQGKTHPSYFITDPLNTSYGTEYNEPLGWLQEYGVEVCITDLRRLRDNNLVYSPWWRAFLQWFSNGGSGEITNPLQKGETTTLRAILEAVNGKANHRKVIVADEDDSYASLLMSANLNDASCYFLNTGIRVKSQAVARHFLEAEKAVARMSDCHIPAEIPPASHAGEARVTPLMGDQIKASILRDLRAARPGDELYVVCLFMTDRDVIEAVIDAANRGVETTLVLDQNEETFMEKRSGFPNPIVAAEITSKASGVEVRWSNTEEEEVHAKFYFLKKRDTCILNTGSANLSRRSLSNTNLEANMRVEAPIDAPACQDALEYVRWLTTSPHTVQAQEARNAPLEYWLYRLEEMTGVTFY